MSKAIPPDPKMHIFVVLRRWANAFVMIDEDTPIQEVLAETGPDYVEAHESDSSIKRWDYNAPFALLPYIDLPNEILEKRGMAVITADGQRGWVKWDMATCPLSSEEVLEGWCPEFMALLEEGNWDVVVLEREEVDMDKHCAFRGDDGQFDMTAQSLWNGDSCSWCGHPVLDKEAPCESCGVAGVSPEGVIKMNEDTTNWDAKMGEEWE